MNARLGKAVIVVGLTVKAVETTGTQTAVAIQSILGGQHEMTYPSLLLIAKQYVKV